MNAITAGFERGHGAAHGVAKQDARVPGDPAGSPAKTSTAGRSDTIVLSAEALEKSGIHDAAKTSGRSGQSTAHRVRSLMEQYPELGGQPFGQLVSKVARGLLGVGAEPPPRSDHQADPVASVSADDADDADVADPAGVAGSEPSHGSALPDDDPIDGASGLIPAPGVSDGNLIDELLGSHANGA